MNKKYKVVYRNRKTYGDKIAQFKGEATVKKGATGLFGSAKHIDKRRNNYIDNMANEAMQKKNKIAMQRAIDYAYYSGLISSSDANEYIKSAAFRIKHPKMARLIAHLQGERRLD